jgi:adenylosuccinate synthase
VQIVTPYHKLLDFMLSAANSSTLKGMSPVHACKVTKRGIRLDHLFGSKENVAARLKKDLDTYFAVVQYKKLSEEQLLKDCQAMNADGNTRIPKHVLDFITAPDKVAFLIELYDKYVVNNPKFPVRKDISYEIRKFLQAGDKVLIEGPQSYWLSNGAEKFWESSTSADTSAVGLQAAARYNTGKYRGVTINVHKTPASSRVGIGANPSGFVAQDYFSRHGIATLRDFGDKCKDFDAIQAAFWTNVQENGIVKPGVWKEGDSEFGLGVAMAAASSLQHGECGATTLKPRVCGMFDCVLHFEVNEAQGPYLTISCFDRGDEYDKVGVVIAYVYYNPSGAGAQSNGRSYKNGDFIKSGDPIPTEHVLAHCHPIVKLINGWKDSPIAAGKRKCGDPLPKGVQQLIGTIEHFTGAEIVSVGNGRNQEDLIYVQRK